MVAAALQMRQIMLYCELNTICTEAILSCRPKHIYKFFRPYKSVGNVRNMLVSFGVNCDAYAHS